jgi:isopentenyl-diphosphate delta-isomerase
MVEKRIHFISRGNTFRSRLAEGYLRSLKLPQLTVTSSGVDTKFSKDVALSPFARDFARTEHITGFMGKTKHQTTSKLLKSQDVLVFFGKDVYEQAADEHEIDARQATVWEVEDLPGFLAKHPRTKPTEANFNKVTVRIANDIFDKVDELVVMLNQSSWSDVYDAENKPLGYRLPVDWVTNRSGLWRRSVHAVVTTANNKFVVEKRSDTIVFAPGMLDVSLGGGVDAHETPRQAVLRELKEELGVKVRPEQVTFLEMRKWSTYHPHYQKYTKTFLYSYHVQLTIDNPIFVMQPSEVQEVHLLSGRKVQQLIRRHRLRRVGALNYGYKYYADIVKRAKIYVK